MAAERTPSNDPFSAGCAFIDGEYVPIGEARIPILDWGFTRSDVTYDVVSVWKGNFFRLEDHLNRFEASAAAMHLTLPHSREAMREVLQECVRMSGLKEAYVEMGLSRGVPPPGSRDPRTCVNRFFAYAIPFVWIATEEQRKRGLHLIISSVRRIPPESVDPKAKNFHWGDLTRGLFEAYERGGETAVLVDGAGHVTEGPGFNVFVVKDGRVATPAEGVLEGITRMTVMELVQQAELPLETRPVKETELLGADEVFLSSTAGGVLPVTRVDDQVLGEGSPGPITQRLRDMYWENKEAGWHATPVRYE